MREIEDFINRVCRSLHVDPALKDHVREELREHLLEAVECHREEGLAEEQAAKRAIEEFGSAEAVGQELRSIHNADLLSFMMKKAMFWREKTMKTEWKWNFVALAALAFTIALEVLLASLCIFWFLPRLQHQFVSVDITIPFPVAEVLFPVDAAVAHYGWIAALLVVAGWLLFELLYRKEGKPNARLAIFAAACMVTTSIFAAASMSALLPSFKLVMCLSSNFERKIGEANNLASDLTEACKKSDWDEIRYDAHSLFVITQNFTSTGAGDIARIRGTREPVKNSRLEELIIQMAENSRQIERSAKAQELPAVVDNLEALKKSLQDFRTTFLQ